MKKKMKSWSDFILSDNAEEIREMMWERKYAKKPKCKYAGFEGQTVLCCAPGMECVDAHCLGFDRCQDYEVFEG